MSQSVAELERELSELRSLAGEVSLVADHIRRRGVHEVGQLSDKARVVFDTSRSHSKIVKSLDSANTVLENLTRPIRSLEASISQAIQQKHRELEEAREAERREKE